MCGYVDRNIVTRKTKAIQLFHRLIIKCHPANGEVTEILKRSIPVNINQSKPIFLLEKTWAYK